MPSREPGDQPDPAAQLLGRWQAHHAGSAEPVEAPEPASTPEPKHAAPRPDPSRRPRATPARPFDQNEAGREVVEALGLTQPTPEPEPDPDPEPATAPEVRRSRVALPQPGESTDVEFSPRLLVRRLTGVLLLVLVVASGFAAYVAYDDPKTVTVGLAATLVVLTLAVYGIRVGSTPTHLAIHSGQLEVVRGSTREIFDLTSRYTRIEVVGTAGRPGWKVLLGRFGKDPLVIDSSMVDAKSFSAELARHRRDSA